MSSCKFSHAASFYPPRHSLISRIFRDLALLSKTKANPKWIVLDGDIDSEWIESMNTVMDDNRMLTLASNERIPLTTSMRLVFEISQLRNATPATVSRAGILFLNDTDVGWGAFKVPPFLSSARISGCFRWHRLQVGLVRVPRGHWGHPWRVVWGAVCLALSPKIGQKCSHTALVNHAPVLSA